MTRHVIAFEGKPSVLPDTWLAPGSLWMEPEERVYISDGFSWDRAPVGWATDLQRNDETGEVSVEIHFFEPGRTIDEKLFECSFWATHLEETQVEATDDIPAHRLILKARVRGVAVIGISANPKNVSQKLHGT